LVILHSAKELNLGWFVKLPAAFLILILQPMLIKSIAKYVVYLFFGGPPILQMSVNVTALSAMKGSQNVMANDMTILQHFTT
jgi:hypothetical protein